MDLKSYLATRAKEVDAALDAFLPKAKERPTTIHEAMRYSVFAGGKRLRAPFFVWRQQKHVAEKFPTP